MQRARTADEYFAKTSVWKNEQIRLRAELLATPLTEEIKWGVPCFTHKGKNIVAICGFKAYFGLWFYQGALLRDKKNVLINAQEGKTKALRQWRMTSGKDIKPTIIKIYVKEAISLVDQGKGIKADRSVPIDVPAELQNALRRSKGATAAFKTMRPGLRREYAEYIATAKRGDTKKKRIDKVLPMITAGVGLHDKYRC